MNTSDRLALLESNVSRLQELADLAPEREARVAGHRWPRLARVVAKSGHTFPKLSDNPDSWAIRFTDSTFTEAEGNQTPTHTDRQADYKAIAHDLSGEYIEENAVVIVTWDNLRWWIISRVDGRIRWAKAQSDWVENGAYPDGDPKVSVKACARDGTGATGDVFDVYLPRNPRSVIDFLHDADPAVYTDFVIGWLRDSEGTRICTTPYLHMGKIGDLREIKATTAIPPGWQEADGNGESAAHGGYAAWDFKHRFSMGRDAAGEAGETAAGQTGGFREHGGGVNDHEDHVLLIADHVFVVTIGDHDPHYALGHNEIEPHHQDLPHDEHPGITFQLFEVVDAVGGHWPWKMGDGFGTTETANGHTHQVSVGGGPVVSWIDQPMGQHIHHVLDLEHNSILPHEDLNHTPHQVDSTQLVHEQYFDSQHTQTDNRPPWKVVIKIERYK